VPGKLFLSHGPDKPGSKRLVTEVKEFFLCGKKNILPENECHSSTATYVSQDNGRYGSS
jgi:hypothetical protein